MGGTRRILASLGACFTAGFSLAAASDAPITIPDPDIRRDATVVAVEKVMPSVVNIGTKTAQERRGYAYDWFRNNWMPYREMLPPKEAAGSGVIIDEEGYVLTNVHVVEGATEIWVTVEGMVYQADPVVTARKTDLALLKIRGSAGERFKAARFAADDDLLLGETVMALGNPYGLGGSVSRGILSSKNRREAFSGPGKLNVPDWLQTDASINFGNSGGPLINLRGEVVGINVAVLKDGQGIGFAIPSKVISEVLSGIFTPETIKGLWFGAQVRAGQLPFVVSEVEKSSPADRAGLTKDDVILKVNGKEPQTLIEFGRQIVETNDLRLLVRHGDVEQQLKVRMVPLKSYFNSSLIRSRLGMDIQELDKSLAEAMAFNFFGGWLISGVEPGGPAEDAGLQQGMVIRSIGGYVPEDIVAAARLVHSLSPGEKVTLDVAAQSRRGLQTLLRSGKVEVQAR